MQVPIVPKSKSPLNLHVLFEDKEARNDSEKSWKNDSINLHSRFCLENTKYSLYCSDNSGWMKDEVRRLCVEYPKEDLFHHSNSSLSEQDLPVIYHMQPICSNNRI